MSRSASSSRSLLVSTMPSMSSDSADPDPAADANAASSCADGDGDADSNAAANKTTLKVWGCRGSIPRSEPDMSRYGGATSCVELLSSKGTRVILDMGSGSYSLGQHIVGNFFRGGSADGKHPKDFYAGGSILITHTHWDHIQGFPFFVPLFIPGMTWDVYGPRGAAGSIRESLAGQMQYDYFPVNLDYLGAKISYHDLTEGKFYLGGEKPPEPEEKKKEEEEGAAAASSSTMNGTGNKAEQSPANASAKTNNLNIPYCQEIGGDLRVTTHYLHHPCLTLGYRLEDTTTNASVCYITDHEPYDMRMGTEGYKPTPATGKKNADDRHVDFIRGADLLIHDTQYTASEYKQKVTWGHSTMEYVVDVALAAGVKKLAIFHHDPMRTDDQIDELVEDARRRIAEKSKEEGEQFKDKDGVELEVFATYDRQVIEMDSHPPNKKTRSANRKQRSPDSAASAADRKKREDEEKKYDEGGSGEVREEMKLEEDDEMPLATLQHHDSSTSNSYYDESAHAIDANAAFATGGGGIMLIFADPLEAKPMAEQMKNSHDCKVYTSVSEALTDANHIHPSVMLVQQSLPGDMDGVEVCRQIRTTMGDWGQSVPILVETKSQEVLEDIRERGDEVGVTDWVSKPYSPEYVRTKITIAMSRVGKVRWRKADLPTNEAERMDTLRATGVLDTDREDRYDRLTRIAARAFDVPMAVISLVDSHRQWFKSCEGLCATETNRDSAFCAHTILQEDVFLIRDALLDDRFADNPLVTGGPHVRFYAGTPLCVGPKRHRVGALCLIDQRPRDLDEKGLQMLKDLGQLVEQELEQSLATERERILSGPPVKDGRIAATTATAGAQDKNRNDEKQEDMEKCLPSSSCVLL